MPRKRRNDAEPSIDDDAAPLSKSDMRELKRRIRDLNDPIRYIIVSAFSRGFVLYFDVTKDAFVMNDVAGGTLFKRRAHAAAVAATMRDGMQIVRVKVGRRGSVNVLSRIKPRRPQRSVRRSRRGQPSSP